MDKSNIKLVGGRIATTNERIEAGKVETIDIKGFPKDGINISSEITLSISGPDKFVGYMAIDHENGKTYHLKKKMANDFNINKGRFGK